MSEETPKNKMDRELREFTEAWQELGRWERKRIYYFAVWCIAKNKINALIAPWILPGFAIRKITKEFNVPTAETDPPPHF